MKRLPVWLVAATLGVIAASAGSGSAAIVARAAGLVLALASLVVLTGWSGQLNLHVAAIGLGWGAYAAAGLAANGVPPAIAIVGAPLVVAPAALVVGLVAVRFRGLELAIATLAAGLAFEQTIFQSLGKWLARPTGGSAFESSLIQLPRPGFLQGDRAWAFAALAIAAMWLTFAALAGRGRIGRAVRAVRDREVVAEARGIPSYAVRVSAFVGATALAAAGGALFAAQTQVVTPESFGLVLSLQLLAVATVAGIRRLEGALVATTLIVLSQEAGGLRLLSWLSGDRGDLIFGVGLIAALAFLVRRRRSRVVAAVPATETARERSTLRAPNPVAFAPTILRVEGVSVAFGSRRVLDGVSLRVGRGEVCGLIGGNGAGKSTLFNCITGLVKPDEGSVFFDGADVTGAPPHRRAGLGVARTFQGVEVFEGLSVRDGLMVVASHGERNEARARDRVERALAEVGVAGVSDASPASLPFATLRLVEIASALVAEPSLVLLDEPLAGLDATERARVLEAIARLREQGRAVLIVEHDLPSVARIADRVFRLESGRIAEQSRRTRKGVAVAARA